MLVDRSSKNFIARSEPLIPNFDERMLNNIFENIMWKRSTRWIPPRRWDKGAIF